MEAEQSKRSLLKTVTWRITASLDTFVIAWIITGDWKMGGSIAGIEVVTKMFFYGEKENGGGYLNSFAI